MKKEDRLLIAIEPELKEKLQQAADSAGVSMSEYIRRLIRSIPVAGKIDGDRVVWGTDTGRE